ncbi:hypothetical protein JXO52_09245 [bacterium]|nr:hypothetical protein [bacterium]
MQKSIRACIVPALLFLATAVSVRAQTDSAGVYLGGITLVDKDGTQIPIKRYAGKVTVLYLWAHG